MRNVKYSTPRCPGTLKPGFSTYSPATIRGIFNGKSVFHVVDELPVTTEWARAKIDEHHYGGQQWYMMKLIRNRPVPSVDGNYILKTVFPGDSTLRFPLEQAGNEHLALQIASQVYGIETVPNALIFFANGQPAIIIRKFNYGDKPPDDFSVYSKSNQARLNYSYYALSKLIDEHVAASMIMKERFFIQVVYSWLIANGEAHIRNFAFEETSRGDLALAPMFNVLCTRLHGMSPEIGAPGGLFDGDRDTMEFREYGHYTRFEFSEFGKRMGLIASRVEKFLNSFVAGQKAAMELASRAFLPSEAIGIFNYNFTERIKRLE